LKDGTQTRFWEDTWMGNQPLKSKYPSLFRRKQDTVATILSSVPLTISFRISLVGNNLRDWHKIVYLLSNVNLQEGRDAFSGHYIHRSNFL
jgi:hypothetical protein